METIPAVRAWLEAIALGIPVVVDDHAFSSGVRLRQFRFPRSKKKRIRKKWSRNGMNFRKEPLPDGMLLNIGGKRMVLINSAARDVLRNKTVVRVQKEAFAPFPGLL